jgi:predicted RNA-binding protein associated with RNAse of E/G family
MPLCIETKLTLSGEAKTYRCELLHYESGFGILRYIIEREYDIQGLKLAPGDETIALYWEGRPYTLYVWRGKAAQDTAYYFNIADRIVLTPQEFLWRDLAVDILVVSRGVRVLDEDELPSDLEAGFLHSIREAQAHILSSYPRIIKEAVARLLYFAPPC